MEAVDRLQPGQSVTLTYSVTAAEPGEVIKDSYLVPLNAELSPGSYELHVGLYLLETLRRLPVLDENGLTINDKVIISGLQAIE